MRYLARQQHRLSDFVWLQSELKRNEIVGVEAVKNKCVLFRYVLQSAKWPTWCVFVHAFPRAVMLCHHICSVHCQKVLL